MTINDVLALARAGFSVAQISALAAADAQQAPAAPAAAPAAPTAPAAPAAPAAPSAPAGDPVQQLLEQMGALTAAVQSANIGASTQPAAQSVDDILAEIINPPKLRGVESNG